MGNKKCTVALALLIAFGVSGCAASLSESETSQSSQGDIETSPAEADFTEAPSVDNAPRPALASADQCKIRQAAPLDFIRAGFPQDPSYAIKNNKLVIQLIYVEVRDMVAKSKPADDVDFWVTGAGDLLGKMLGDDVSIEWRYNKEYVRLPKLIIDYRITRSGGGDPLNLVQSAIDSADEEINFTGVDIAVAVLPPTLTGAQADYSPALPLAPDAPFNSDEGLVYRGAMTGSDTRWERGYLLLAHEVGHLLGLQDYYAFDAGDSYEAQFKYMGEFDNMNNAPGLAIEWSAWSRWLIGALDDDQIRCLEVDGLSNHQIFALADPTKDEKALVIPLGKYSAVVAESRRSIGYDESLPTQNQGVLVYRVDTTKLSGFGPLQILKKEGARDPMLLDSMLKIGESVEVEGVRITRIEAGRKWDVVSVERISG
jgi:hypothetical protein